MIAGAHCSPRAGEVLIRYFGWSSIEVTTGAGRRFYFDANYSRFDQEDFPAPDRYTDAAAFSVSHGHFDHCQDLPALARRLKGTVITSPALGKFFTTRHGLPASRIRSVTGGEQLDEGGLTITPRSWVHRTLSDRWPALLARRPGGVLKMRTALKCLLSSPLLGFKVESPGSPPITCIGEAFHGQTDLERVRSARSACGAEIALIALEPGLESEIARATATYAPRAAVVYSGHSPMWHYFGLPPVDFARFASELEELAPEILVHVLAPGEHVMLDVA